MSESGATRGVLGWAVAALVGVAFYAFLTGVFAPRPPAPPPVGPGQTPGPPPPGGKGPSRRSLGLGFAAEEDGLRVRELHPGGPALRAGLRPDDLLLAVDGRSLRAADGGGQVLLAHLEGLGEATALTFRVRRVLGPEEEVRVELLQEGSFEGPLAAELIGAAVAQLLELRRPAEAPGAGLWPGYLDPRQPSVAVTALAAWALRRADTPEARAALPGALELLLTHQAADGGLTDPGALYAHRVYGTSLLVLALGDEARWAGARERAREWLAAAQVQESHGIDCYDARWGGWSYRDTYGADLRTDVSTARFALLALDAAGLPLEHAAWTRARAFLDETQNLALRLEPDAPDVRREAALRDGGFAFGPRMSKAGSAGAGPLAVFRSYGSATADGLLGLLALDRVDGASWAGPGPLRLDPRAAAALGWLARSWDLGQNPGFSGELSSWGGGVYFYWLWAASEALHRCGVWSLTREGKERAWAPELVRLLANLKNQGGGRFVGRSRMMHEDVPTLAASMAILALAPARDRLALGKGARLPEGPPPPPLPAAPQVLVAPPASAVGRGRALFQERTCAGCHLDDGSGNGPALRAVGAVYLAQEGTPEAARARLLAFLRDPTRVPGLLRDERQMLPAPSMGVKEEELEDLAAWLLSRTGER